MEVCSKRGLTDISTPFGKRYRLFSGRLGIAGHLQHVNRKSNIRTRTHADEGTHTHRRTVALMARQIQTCPLQNGEHKFPLPPADVLWQKRAQSAREKKVPETESKIVYGGQQLIHRI